MSVIVGVSTLPFWERGILVSSYGGQCSLCFKQLILISVSR